MYRILSIAVLCLTLVLLGYPSQPVDLAMANEYSQSLTPLFDNLGDYHHEITTNSKLAQKYFDQGLILAAGFNHAEAANSFQEAARIDPQCGMCYWGIAYVLGPNINAAMDDRLVDEANYALAQAKLSSNNATAKEKAYIQALAKRYPREAVRDRQTLDLAYAEAMGKVAANYPDDLDAAAIYAEALMDTMPWDYWQKNGQPKPATVKLLSTLESILDRDPNHIQANHLYIHAVEKQHPELGIAAADRLRNLVPGSGHLVHMPSHIYIRVGRYQDAVTANLNAIAADSDYRTKSTTKGLYNLAYMPHNHHFLWYGATMAGQKQIATAAARETAKMVDRKLMQQPGYEMLQHFYSIPLYNAIKFGMWDEILTTPAPQAKLKYPTGVWHYARGMAFNAQNQLTAAQAELKQLQKIASDPELNTVTAWNINSTADLLQIATNVLAGEIAAKEGNYKIAIPYLQTAVELEDNLTYDEPPPWHSPVRQNLGAVLLEMNRPTEAEAVYRQDLLRYPENGWDLFGLAQSLAAQGKTAAAESVKKRFAEAWQNADITLVGSRF